MSNSSNARKVNSPAITLANGATFYLIDNLTCPICGDGVRAFDAELLQPGTRLLCRRHHVIFELVP
jgi:hypothetical protein